MEAVLWPDVWSNLVRFLLAVVFAYYIPGNLLVKDIKISFWPKIGLSLTLGLVLWGYQGFILGLAKVRMGTYVYLVTCFLLWVLAKRGVIKDLLRERKSWAFSRLKIDFLLLVIVAMGIFLQLSAVWFMGTLTERGLFFCCRGVPDGVYHLALTNALVKNMPPFEPGAAGVIVRNYHYWSNLIMAETIRVFGLDLTTTVYKFFPLLLTLLLAGAATTLSDLLGLGKVFARTINLFIFFSGDLLYVFTLILGRGINFQASALDDATKLLAGPPRSFSIVIIFWAICFLVIWFKKRNYLSDFVLALLFASLAGIKLYTAVFALIGLAFLSLYFFWKKDFQRLIMPIATVLLSIAIYLPVNGNSNGIVLVYPWIFREFITKKEFGLTSLELARRIFVSGGKWFHALLYDVYFAILYFVFVFGTSLLALVQTRKSLALFPKLLNIFLIPAILVSTFLGFASATKIGGGNTIQFLAGQYFFLAIYCALALTRLMNVLPRRIKLALVILVVSLTIPKAVHEGIQNFVLFRNREEFLVSQDELSALNFLKTVKDNEAIILLDPESADKETSLHVSFLSDKPVFLAGFIGVLADHQIAGASQRRIGNGEIFTSSDPQIVNRLLSDNHIKYLYFPKINKPRIDNLDPDLVPVFKNSTIEVLRYSPLSI